MEDEIQLFSSTNEYEINQICAILEENNVPYVKSDYGSGSYMNLYMGHSIQEKSIFVHKNDYEKALELISFFEPINDGENIEPELAEKMDEDLSSKKYETIKHSLGFLILGVPILLVLIAIIATLFLN